MKNKLIVSSLLMGLTVLNGCKPPADKPGMPKVESASVQLDKAQAATKEAAHDMKDYAFTQKDEFVAGMKTQLSELNRTVDELSARVEKSADAIKAEAQPKIASLREQAARLNRQLESVQNSSATTWDGLKADTHKTFQAMKDGLAQMRQWVADKIAP